MASFEFCPAGAGTWTLTPNDLVLSNEESAHAVVAALMNLPILDARVDRPEVGVGGHVSIAGQATEPVSCEDDIRRADYRRLLAILAGPVFVGAWDSWKWPLDADDQGDVGLVARYCRWLRYDWVDLFVAEQRVKALLRDKAVNRAIKAVGTELLDQGAILGARVYELVVQAEVDPDVVNKALLPLVKRSESRG